MLFGAAAAAQQCSATAVDSSCSVWATAYHHLAPDGQIRLLLFLLLAAAAAAAVAAGAGGEDGTVRVSGTCRTPGCQREYGSRAAVNTVVLHPNQGELISGRPPGAAARLWH